MKPKPDVLDTIHPLAKEAWERLRSTPGSPAPKEVLVAVSGLMEQGVSWEDAGAVVIATTKLPGASLCALVKEARLQKENPYLVESKRLLLPSPERPRPGEERASARLHLYRAEIKGATLFDGGLSTIYHRQITDYVEEIEKLFGRPMTDDELLHTSH